MEFIYGSARLVELWFTETVDDVDVDEDEDEEGGALVDVILTAFMLVVIRRSCFTLALPVFTVVLFVSPIFLSRKLPNRWFMDGEPAPGHSQRW